MEIKENSFPELLSPCGSPEAIDAAINGGADAVYFGGTMFNARMNAKNFGRGDISDAIAKCHDSGVKAYITFNTQVLDRELKNALEYAEFLYNEGADALILADCGVSSLIHKYLPDLELHASTQMTAHNVSAADELYRCGFARVVGSRELSKTDIRTLCRDSKPQIELFVHGAICVSCSGQCLMSAMLGGRSGNRGECAQPCRMSYNGSYPISLKDMCLAGHIPELIDSGVASLKIEGRMKNPAYVYGVTSIYRRLLDERRSASPKEISELERLFSRGGFTDGYFVGKKDSAMLGTRSEKNISQSRDALSHGTDHLKTANGAIRGEKISIVREKASIPKAPEFTNPRRAAKKPYFTARFRSPSQIPESDIGFFKHIFLPISSYNDIADGVIMPPVIFDSEYSEIMKKLDNAVKKGAKHVLISNISHLQMIKDSGLVPHGDFRLNAFNSFSCDFWTKNADLESLILSAELILPQIRDIRLPESTSKGAVIYGRLPLMLLEKPVGKPSLRDTRGATFPIISSDGRDSLYNSVPVYMADQLKRLDESGIEDRHMIFSTESKGEAMKTVYAYKHSVIPKEPIRRLK